MTRPLPWAARRPPGKRFYGWTIAAGCMALMFVGIGIGYYALAVFLRPLQKEQGWSNAAVSAATGVYFSVSGLTGAILGPRIDRHGPIRIMTIGSLLLGAAVTMVGFVEELWQLFAVYTVLAVAWSMAAAVPVSAVMSRWFVARRARAMSIAFTGVSLGGVVLAPLGTFLIDRGGLALATPVFGALMIVVAIPVIRFVIVWDPSEMGLQPDGAVAASAVAEQMDERQHRTWTRGDAARTIAFWAILVSFVLVLVAQTGFVIHQLSFLEDRFGSRGLASLALSTTAMGSIIARLVVGTFADRIDKRVLASVLMMIQAAAVIAIVAWDNQVASFAFVLVVGFTIGNIYMMQNLLIGEIFGLVSFATVAGLVGFATQVGSGVGPLAVGALEEATGSYTVPFIGTALLTVAAAIAVLFARPSEPVAGASDHDDGAAATLATGKALPAGLVPPAVVGASAGRPSGG